MEAKRWTVVLHEEVMEKVRAEKCVMVMQDMYVCSKAEQFRDEEREARQPQQQILLQLHFLWGFNRACKVKNKTHPENVNSRQG